jgi:hypothetical protein
MERKRKQLKKGGKRATYLQGAQAHQNLRMSQDKPRVPREKSLDIIVPKPNRDYIAERKMFIITRSSLIFYRRCSIQTVHPLLQKE